MAQISLTFPDGNAREYEAGVTPAQIAEGISKSLSKKAVSASVNGAHWDLQWPIHENAAIAIHNMGDQPQAPDLFRHDCGHRIARAVTERYHDMTVAPGTDQAVAGGHSVFERNKRQVTRCD